jgi:hypothetical protein
LKFLLKFYSLKRWATIAVLMIVLSLRSAGQDKGILSPAVIYEGDTIPMVRLEEVVVVSWLNRTPKQERQLTKLMRNVKIAYPYAHLAGIKLLEYEDTLAMASSEKEKRQIMKRVEVEIEAEYGQELRDLTFTQGKILLKLIDRETGNSSYDLVADLRGEFRAVFYQAFARIFSYNLKVKYDPEGEDKDIEMIVRMIENGLI